ncbi:hypothetical protein EG329_004840 [Mollisiaceae sp. DMI_Dod_QoI]|nr:hypothetical protein EG329_004840 [Helotiales sp. DMI_Dod_QoI]
MCIELRYVYKDCGCLAKIGTWTCGTAKQAKQSWSPSCARFKTTQQILRVGERTCLHHVGLVLRELTPELIEAKEGEGELEGESSVIAVGDEKGNGQEEEGRERKQEKEEEQATEMGPEESFRSDSEDETDSDESDYLGYEGDNEGKALLSSKVDGRAVGLGLRHVGGLLQTTDGRKS